MYYWGEPDASVTFCEDKYTEVFWIAEYYNTLSAFFYIFVGMCFLPTRISKIAWCVIGIGVGSILLHATLRYYGQWVDEIFMILTCFRSLQYIRPTLKSYFLPIILFFYFILSHFFVVFLTFFTLMNLPLLYITLKSNSLWGRLYLFFFSCGFVCWVLDQLACFYLQELQLHAWWHIFTGFALIFAMLELLNNMQRTKK
jgi:dihydroceramidase